MLHSGFMAASQADRVILERRWSPSEDDLEQEASQPCPGGDAPPHGQVPNVPVREKRAREVRHFVATLL